jgi:prepilin-type N-terminal cleavage/methylation domain-containing protein
MKKDYSQKPLFTSQPAADFTTTSEEENENLFSFFSSAVGAKPASLKKVAGFTLVEVIVSLAIFAVVVTVAMVGLLTVLDASRQARAGAETVDNLNFVVDDMIRRIRTGYDFDCAGGGDCLNGDDEFSFNASSVSGEGNPKITYKLGTAANANGQIQRSIQGGAVGLTSPAVNVTNLTFYVTGTGTGDNEQSRVMILIEAEVSESDTLAKFSLQTTVTQRLLFNP